MDNHSWEVIENNYLKGDRYLKAEKADSKGRCSEMGTAVPIIEQSYPANSTPEEYKYWSEKLQDYAKSTAAHFETQFWLKNLKRTDFRLPRDFSDGENTVESLDRVEISFLSCFTASGLTQ